PAVRLCPRARPDRRDDRLPDGRPQAGRLRAHLAMRLSRRSRGLLRLAIAVGLAFIYIPLIVVAIYAFNASNILEWPPPGLTLDWFPKAVENEFARDAFVTTLKAGVAAPTIAVLLGTLASLAVARHHFFGRETISFLVILP